MAVGTLAFFVLLAVAGIALLRRLPALILNAVAGVVLLVLANGVLATPIPVDLTTALICAVGGAPGWLAVLLLHVLGLAF